MNADSFFAIGSRHAAQGTPCEDYARAGFMPDAGATASRIAWAAVADGCSGAMASTDVGARTLVHAFEHALSQRTSMSTTWLDALFIPDLIDAVRARRITARKEDYYATLLAMASTPARAELLLLGDGAVALCFTDGRCRVRWTEWPCNAPYYLAYRLDRIENAAYLERFGGNVVEHVVDFVPGHIEDVVEKTRILAPETYLNGERFVFEPQRQGIAGIALFSDGLMQIGDVPVIAAADACLSFKTFRGSFVKRRLLRATKAFAKQGELAHDDLAAAAIWYEDDLDAGE